MNHKRKGPKSTRAGCLLCKPHKRQGVDAPARQEQRGRDVESFYLKETQYGMDSEYDRKLERVMHIVGDFALWVWE